jgi:plasmid stabilization system protein ParE
VRRARYVLTARAAADLRKASIGSRARWGNELTSRYFDDLHLGAQFIAESHLSVLGRQDLSGGTALLVYPVREHYLVYEPLGERFIAIVAVIRQGRDLPSLLQKWTVPIRRELLEIRARIERSEIAPPMRSTVKPRRKK